MSMVCVFVGGEVDGPVCVDGEHMRARAIDGRRRGSGSARQTRGRRVGSIRGGSETRLHASCQEHGLARPPVDGIEAGQRPKPRWRPARKWARPRDAGAQTVPLSFARRRGMVLVRQSPGRPARWRMGFGKGTGAQLGQAQAAPRAPPAAPMSKRTARKDCEASKTAAALSTLPSRASSPGAPPSEPTPALSPFGASDLVTPGLTPLPRG